MPIEASVLLGVAGFSSNSKITPSSSTFMIPIRVASSTETSMTGMVQSACVFLCCPSILA
jgi:hypothetical protein